MITWQHSPRRGRAASAKPFRPTAAWLQGQAGYHACRGTARTTNHLTPGLPDTVKHWPLDRLIPYARNARTHDDDQVVQIAAPIVELGWTNPILVDAEGGIVAGNGRLLRSTQARPRHGSGRRSGSPDAGPAPRLCNRRQQACAERRSRAPARSQSPAPRDPLQVELWPMDRLLPYAANARTHPDEQVAQIAGSIEEFGFNLPCLIDDRRVLIAGHGRIVAA